MKLNKNKKSKTLPVSRRIQKLTLILTGLFFLSLIATPFAGLIGTNPLDLDANSWITYMFLYESIALVFFAFAYWLGDQTHGQLWRGFMATLYTYAFRLLAQIIGVFTLPLAKEIVSGSGDGDVMLYSQITQIIPSFLAFIAMIVVFYLTKHITRVYATPLHLLYAIYALFIVFIFTFTLSEPASNSIFSTVTVIGGVILCPLITYFFLPRKTPHSVRTLHSLLYTLLVGLSIVAFNNILMAAPTLTTMNLEPLINFAPYTYIIPVVIYFAILIWARRTKHL